MFNKIKLNFKNVNGTSQERYENFLHTIDSTHSAVGIVLR